MWIFKRSDENAVGVMGYSSVRWEGDMGRKLTALVQFFAEPDLDQRLIGHVAAIGGGLDAFQQ